MNNRIQLLHPSGKKGIAMDQDKYNILKKALIKFLSLNGESAHSEIFKEITEDFKKNQVKFEGSMEWHLEWVMLDMEARKEIKRTSDKTPVKFMIINQLSK
jgi:hypothetical protein